MAGYAFRDPNDSSAPIFWALPGDPMIPTGYVFCGSDGAYDVPQKMFTAGLNSGGYPAYTGDASAEAIDGAWPNGILAATVGRNVDGGNVPNR